MTHQRTMFTGRSSIVRIGFAVLLSALCFAGCHDGQSEVEEAGAVIGGFNGFSTGKADTVNNVSKWEIREAKGGYQLQGLDYADETVFQATIQVTDDGHAMVLFEGDANCQVVYDTHDMVVLDTDCTAENLEVLGDPGHELLESLAPVLAAADGKADGFLTKVGCVAAGIGAAVVVLAALKVVVMIGGFAASGVAVPVVMGGGAVVGAVATCYSAFSESAPLTECVADCDADQGCIGECIDTEQTRIDELPEGEMVIAQASALLQCLSGCEDTDTETQCQDLCYGLVISGESD